ncbi:STE like transcription factor-domain-containing protein [Scheffersomyces amazonensis]|uniref:STE like transcription factor-domain-containing protein n=1 Tax=Scheffersomyces amazonensis TaxID=1078765 RepID=UPI00315D276D
MTGVTIKQEINDLSPTTEEAEDVQESLRLIEDLKFFLATAPANWQENQVIRRYYLNPDEGFVSCVFWNNLYFVTGTDIVRCIVYKFQHFGRKIIDRKKFEEGIFSDLRNLKCGTDAILEPPRSEFLEFLFKNSCLRTQKKQKVFFWFNVPHDKLMADALERDLKKEKQDQSPTTIAVREPAQSFEYDETQTLYTQLAEHMAKQKKLIDEQEDKSSPEYSTTTNPILLQPQGQGQGHGHGQGQGQGQEFEFLNHETPSQFKANSDNDDDFPLDYFDTNGQIISDDYVNLDTNFKTGGTSYNNVNEENYDSIVDSSFFFQPLSQGAGTSQVAYNEEYLIEQTLPMRTPVSQLPIQPKILSSKEEMFPPFPNQFQPPLSAKFQAFPRNSITPSQSMFPSHYIDQSGQPIVMPPSDYPVSYNMNMNMNMAYHEPDYWLPMYGDGGQYVVPNEQEFMVPVNNPPFMHLAHSQSIARSPYVVYPQSHSMSQAMSSRLQQQQQQQQQQQPQQPQQQQQPLKHSRQKSKAGITKPVHDNGTLTHRATLDQVINNNNTRIVSKDIDTSDAFDGGIPTPMASTSHLEN